MKWALSLLLVIAASSSAAMTPFGAILVRLSEKLPILLSVLLAAVFVRLARGMPTIPYEKVAPSQSLVATRAFRALVRSYVQTFFVFVIAIVINLFVSSLGPEDNGQIVPWLIPATLGLLDSMVILSILFLIMSDVTLANIQADMMDEVTNSLARADAGKAPEIIRKAFEGAELPRVRRTDEP